LVQKEEKKKKRNWDKEKAPAEKDSTKRIGGKKKSLGTYKKTRFPIAPQRRG